MREKATDTAQFPDSRMRMIIKTTTQRVTSSDPQNCRIEKASRHGTSGWLPKDHQLLRNWVHELVQRSECGPSTPLQPILVELRNTVNANGMLRALADNMFVEVPTTPPYCLDPSLQNPQVRDFEHMLLLFNTLLREPPRWYNTGDPNANSFVGFPFNAILDWPMNTSSGYWFFLSREINDNFQAILGQWGKYLTSKDSAKALNSVDGWFSPDALRRLTATGNDAAGAAFTFPQLYQCPNPDSPTYGFQSWDQFFTREFNWDKRPVEHENDDSIIVHSAESIPWRKQDNVRLSDTFYLKGQPYSLQPMLNNEPEAAYFAGGTVYQAFLSPLSYHRWHVPISGTITKIRNVPGTYYSESWYQGFNNPDGPDPTAADRSQAYIAHVATRGYIFIQADNPAIGLMGIVYVGMAECSSVDFTVYEGQHIKKGDQLGRSSYINVHYLGSTDLGQGMFHYGGSTHCLIFGPNVKLQFKEGLMDNTENNQMVRSYLARVVAT